jgi:hypothetical protein
MARSRKRPCTICRQWFLPDPRIGKRQRACRKPQCQAARRKKTQAAWRAKNPDCFIGRRIQERGSKEQPPLPLRMSSPLSRLPWDLAQDQFKVQGADFIGVMVKLVLRAAQDQIRSYVAESNRVSGTHGPQTPKDEMRLGP